MRVESQQTVENQQLVVTVRIFDKRISWQDKLDVALIVIGVVLMHAATDWKGMVSGALWTILGIVSVPWWRR